jgi:hypothetical protein
LKSIAFVNFSRNDILFFIKTIIKLKNFYILVQIYLAIINFCYLMFRRNNGAFMDWCRLLVFDWMCLFCISITVLLQNFSKLISQVTNLISYMSEGIVWSVPINAIRQSLLTLLSLIWRQKMLDWQGLSLRHSIALRI